MLHKMKVNEDHTETNHMGIKESGKNITEKPNDKTNLLTYLTNQEYPGDIQNVLYSTKANKM